MCGGGCMRSLFLWFKMTCRRLFHFLRRKCTRYSRESELRTRLKRVQFESYNLDDLHREERHRMNEQLCKASVDLAAVMGASVHLLNDETRKRLRAKKPALRSMHCAERPSAHRSKPMPAKTPQASHGRQLKRGQPDDDDAA